MVGTPSCTLLLLSLKCIEFSCTYAMLDASLKCNNWNISPYIITLNTQIFSIMMKGYASVKFIRKIQTEKYIQHVRAAASSHCSDIHPVMLPQQICFKLYNRSKTLITSVK